jgi:hypothetical protein
VAGCNVVVGEVIVINSSVMSRSDSEVTNLCSRPGETAALKSLTGGTDVEVRGSESWCNTLKGKDMMLESGSIRLLQCK